MQHNPLEVREQVYMPAGQDMIGPPMHRLLHHTLTQLVDTIRSAVLIYDVYCLQR